MLHLVGWLLLLLVVLVVWLALGHPLTETAFALPLGACDLTVYQDRQIVALACPGRDLIRIWPLPVVSPWFEEPIEIPTAQAA